jgi:hypothetical protein
VFKALYRASDPSRLLDAPMFRERTDASYREGSREPLPPPTWILPAPLVAWWILHDAGYLSGIVIRSVGAGVAIGWVAAARDVAAGALCALVVRSIDARQRELCRRLEASESVISP